MFDQLKNSTNTVPEKQIPPQPVTSLPSSTQLRGSSGKLKNLRVRVKRAKPPGAKKAVSSEEPPTSSTVDEVETSREAAVSSSATEVVQNGKLVTASSTAAATSTTAQNNCELLCWLKGLTELPATSQNHQIFQEMRISAGGTVVFIDLDGLDYAFYDTGDRACLGYLRFKPRYAKSVRRAKKYHLHFIVLSGEFIISTDNEQSHVKTSDMVAINIGTRYSIVNNTDDIAILMVIKK